MNQPIATKRVPGRWLVGILLVWLLGGCASGLPTFPEPVAANLGERGVIQLMPLDMDQSELTYQNTLTVTNQWVGEAAENLRTALRNALEARGYILNLYESPPGAPLFTPAQRQRLLLYEAISDTILTHHYQDDNRLPTKRSPHWSLGPSAVSLANQGSHFALFVHVRDEYLGTARSFLKHDLEALGISISGPQQKGFACLVDLKSGDVVWFHRFYRSSGDMRTLMESQEAVDHILKNFP